MTEDVGAHAANFSMLAARKYILKSKKQLLSLFAC